MGKARGVLDAGEARGKFVLGRSAPCAELAPYVMHYWSVRWDLRGQPPYVSEVLAHPSVHVVFERGRSAVHGVVRGRFTRELEGQGRVLGIKFHPGAFYPLVRVPVSRLTDRVLPLASLLGAAWEALEPRVLSHAEDPEAVQEVEQFLRAQLRAAPDAAGLRVRRLVERIAAAPELTTVEGLAAASGLGPRTLQRLFHQYVGVGPKWVIQRFRLHEAAERLKVGEAASLTDLALSLGYFDQAHFIHDFKATVGRAPSEFARALHARPEGGQAAPVPGAPRL